MSVFVGGGGLRIPHLVSQCGEDIGPVSFPVAKLNDFRTLHPVYHIYHYVTFPPNFLYPGFFFVTEISILYSENSK